MTTGIRKEKIIRVGRKPKSDPAKYRYTVNLTEEENFRFLQMLDSSGIKNISRYLNHLIFGKEIKVVKIDKATMDFYIRLTNFYHQFQAVGNNYNQTVKAIKSNFGEKRALSLLYKLEKYTLELVYYSKQIIALTQEYEEKWLRK